MKTTLCMLVLAVAAVYGAEDKKNEKRGVLGLGYGVASAPLVGHGYYGHGLATAAHAPLLSHGYYGHGLGLYGNGLSHGGYYGHGLTHGDYYGHGLTHGGYYGHGLASAPLLGHGVSYSAPLAYDSHYLGLGHGWH